MPAPKLIADKKKAVHAPVQALPGVSQPQATIGSRADKPPRRQLVSGAHNQMHLDLDHIVAKLRQSWLSDKEDLEILEIVRKYWKDDQAAKASGEKFEWGYLDAFVQQLKGRAFSDRTFSSGGVQQHQMVYDALWYALDEPALSDFKQLMVQSREATPPDAKPENVWSTVGKQEAVAGWGILKGMGTTLAGVASPVAAEELAKYFDESGDILLGKEWHEGEALYKWGGISLNARQIGTAGGGVIMQLALQGKSKSKDTSDAFKKAQHVLGVISNIQGAVQATNQIADVVVQRGKIGNLSADTLLRDPEFLGPMIALIASVHALATGSSARGDKAKHDRIQLLIQSAQLLPEIERIIEIQNSNKAPEVKQSETGEIVVGIIGQVVGLMISGAEYRQTHPQGTTPPQKDVGKSTAEKTPPLPGDEALPQGTAHTEIPDSGKPIAEDKQLSTPKKKTPLTLEASSSEQIANDQLTRLAAAKVGVSAKPQLGAPQGPKAVASVESPVTTPETAGAQLTAAGQPVVVNEPSINLRAAETVDQNAKLRGKVIPVIMELGTGSGFDLRIVIPGYVVEPVPASKPRAPVEPTTIPQNTTEPAGPQLNSAAELSVPMPRETPQVIAESPKDFDSMNSLSAEQQIGFRVFKPEASSDATPMPQSTNVRKPLRASSSVTLNDVPPADVLDFLAKQKETPPESTRLQIQPEIPQADQRSAPLAELGMSLSSREQDSTNPGPDIESPAPKARTDIPSVNEFLLPPQAPAKKSIGPKKPNTAPLGSAPNLLGDDPAPLRYGPESSLSTAPQKPPRRIFMRSAQVAPSEVIPTPLPSRPMNKTPSQVGKKRSGAEIGKRFQKENQKYWESRKIQTKTRRVEKLTSFARHEQNFNSLGKTLRNKKTQLDRAGLGHLLPNVNMTILDMPIDHFIRTHGSKDLLHVWEDLGKTPHLRAQLAKEWGVGSEGMGVGLVGTRRPDIVEFLLDRSKIEVTDITTDLLGAVHRFKSKFYQEVLQNMLGKEGPRIFGLDIDPTEGFRLANLHD